MSEEILELLRAGYDAANRRDFALQREMASDDFELHSIFLPGRVLRGKMAAEELYAELDEVLVDYTQTVERFVEVGDDVVVAIVRLDGTGRESGAAVSQQHATVWTFRDGKFISGVSFTDPAEALASVGVEEPR
jgi:ketosteroid isomerase-like protein